MTMGSTLGMTVAVARRTTLTKRSNDFIKVGGFTIKLDYKKMYDFPINSHFRINVNSYHCRHD